MLPHDARLVAAGRVLQRARGISAISLRARPFGTRILTRLLKSPSIKDVLTASSVSRLAHRRNRLLNDRCVSDPEKLAAYAMLALPAVTPFGLVSLPAATQ
jgi:hypothetical protein